VVELESTYLLRRGQAICSRVKAGSQQDKLRYNGQRLCRLIIDPLGPGNARRSGSWSVSIEQILHKPASQANLCQSVKALAPFLKKQVCKWVVEYS
jgi:hypothetical protein